MSSCRLWITRPDLPVAAWPTADHSEGVSAGFESGLVVAFAGCSGETWESVGRPRCQHTKYARYETKRTAKTIGSRGTIVKETIVLVHVQLRVHSRQYDFGRFCRDWRFSKNWRFCSELSDRVSLRKNLVKAPPGRQPAHHMPEARHIDI